MLGVPGYAAANLHAGLPRAAGDRLVARTGSRARARRPGAALLSSCHGSPSVAVIGWTGGMPPAMLTVPFHAVKRVRRRAWRREHDRAVPSAAVEERAGRMGRSGTLMMGLPVDSVSSADQRRGGPVSQGLKPSYSPLPVIARSRAPVLGTPSTESMTTASTASQSATGPSTRGPRRRRPRRPCRAGCAGSRTGGRISSSSAIELHRQLGQDETVAGHLVRRQDAGAAAVGDHRDAPALAAAADAQARRRGRAPRPWWCR